MTSTIERTLQHALFLSRHINGSDPQCAIVVVLLELGVATKRAGFDYLKTAILLRYKHPTQLLTKELYPDVGRSYDPEVSGFQVEQSIRSAIARAWKERDEKAWALYFPAGIDGTVKRPSNADFISMIARFIELWKSCCKGGAYDGEE
ncbi:MAG: sporulation initiation factor Spo0A C-terminal domain-containing protein [Oscillospiraceae bacterium]|nr:sporulation initiation factor Spo0A C-terminal domain-containing protein [Oscillospiraceae bacterium]